MISNDTIISLQQQASEFFPSTTSDGHLTDDLNALLEKVNAVRILNNDDLLLSRKIKLQENSIDTVVKNQERLRDNLEKLTEHHGDSQLVNRYLQDMNRDEDTLLEARQKVLDLSEEQETLKKNYVAMEEEIKKLALNLADLCADLV